jgi:hypothetical protein
MSEVEISELVNMVMEIISEEVGDENHIPDAGRLKEFEDRLREVTALS